jgi:hypothetical protein
MEWLILGRLATMFFNYNFDPFFLVGLAATVPWLDLFVSLLGAVKMSTLSIMAPALIDTVPI